MSSLRSLIAPAVLAGGLWVPASGVLGAPLAAQQVPDTRARIAGLRLAPLRFTPPMPKRVQLSNGAPVFLLEDHSLPLINVNIASRVGVAHLPDSMWAAGWVADAMLRTGGTTALSPDSVDRLLEFYAINVFFSTGQEQSTAAGFSLSRYTGQMLELLFDMMRNPRNDSSRIAVQIAQAEEQWRRRNDQPGAILGRYWSQLMYGQHPFARTMIRPEEARAFAAPGFRTVQGQIFCPENLLIGVSGDFDERALLSQLEQRFRGWPRCAGGLRAVPPVTIASGPRIIFIEKDINQTNLRMGHAGALRVADTPDYFASRVTNFVLGGGGFTSRLLQRVRSDSGFAYSVGSGWGASVRREGIFNAGAQTRAPKTVAAIELMRRTIASMVTSPAADSEVSIAKDYELNSFVFRFENPSQIVGQQLAYAIDNLPANWFDIYLRGVQAVTPADVRRVAERYLRPDQMTLLVVGKSSAFDRPLSTLGPVQTISLEQDR